MSDLDNAQRMLAIAQKDLKALKGMIDQETFDSEIFDLVVSLDVMEHVDEPEKAFCEIYRTLKPGGAYVCTFPIRNNQTFGWERRFIRHPGGELERLKPPEIHGNPIDPEGSIVTVDYGYDVHKTITQWTGFDVRVYRFSDAEHGILGEYTEVCACVKPW